VQPTAPVQELWAARTYIQYIAMLWVPCRGNTAGVSVHCFHGLHVVMKQIAKLCVLCRGLYRNAVGHCFQDSCAGTMGYTYLYWK